MWLMRLICLRGILPEKIEMLDRNSDETPVVIGTLWESIWRPPVMRNSNPQILHQHVYNPKFEPSN